MENLLRRAFIPSSCSFLPLVGRLLFLLGASLPARRLNCSYWRDVLITFLVPAIVSFSVTFMRRQVDTRLCKSPSFACYMISIFSFRLSPKVKILPVP